MKKFGRLHLHVLHEISEVRSDTILINAVDSNQSTLRDEASIKRTKRLDAIRSIASSNVIASNVLVPDDFDFSGSLTEAPDLLNQFYSVHQGLLLSSVFDISNVVNNRLTGKLNGYKALNFTLDATDPSFLKARSELREIYRWVFESGSLIDKMGLSRNIISLHLVNGVGFELIPDSFQAILSSYKVYEKQNIKQYIEIRNKLSDQLLDYSKRASSVVDSFAAAFQKSALAVLTLFVSVLAARFLSTTTPTARFLVFTTALSLAFVLLSVVYLFVARWEVSAQRKRLELSYKNFKARQEDLLNSGDVQRILNNDKDFNDDLSFIRRKMRSYTILWCAVLILVVTVVVFYLRAGRDSFDENNIVIGLIMKLVVAAMFATD